MQESLDEFKSWPDTTTDSGVICLLASERVGRVGWGGWGRVGQGRAGQGPNCPVGLEIVCLRLL